MSYDRNSGRTRFKVGDEIWVGGCIPAKVLQVIPGQFGTKRREMILVDISAVEHLDSKIGPEWIRADNIGMGKDEVRW